MIAILISKNSYYYTNILPIMLALCSMLSDTYYAHNYASIIGGSLLLSIIIAEHVVVLTTSLMFDFINSVKFTRLQHLGTRPLLY